MPLGNEELIPIAHNSGDLTMSEHGSDTEKNWIWAPWPPLWCLLHISTSQISGQILRRLGSSLWRAISGCWDFGGNGQVGLGSEQLGQGESAPGNWCPGEPWHRLLQGKLMPRDLLNAFVPRSLVYLHDELSPRHCCSWHKLLYTFCLILPRLNRPQTYWAVWQANSLLERKTVFIQVWLLLFPAYVFIS